jgi:hypothetical protein
VLLAFAVCQSRYSPVLSIACLTLQSIPKVPALVLLRVRKPLCCGMSGTQASQRASRIYRPGAARCSSLAGYRPIAATSTLRSLHMAHSWMRSGTEYPSPLTWVQAHLDWKHWGAHGLGNVRGTCLVGPYSKQEHCLKAYDASAIPRAHCLP